MALVLKTFVATLMDSFENIGGYLDIGEDSLLFRSSHLTKPSREIVIPYYTITHIQTNNTWGLIPNGLRLVTLQGRYHFVVREREQLLLEISSRMKGVKETR